MAYGGILEKKRERAAWAVVEHGTIRAAAHALGIPERTMRRWATTPAFQAAARQAQSAAVVDATRRLAGAGAEAVDTLLEVMRDKGVAPGVRVRAALGVLSMMITTGEFVDFDARLRAIEEGGMNEVSHAYESESEQATGPN